MANFASACKSEIPVLIIVLS